MISEQLQMDGLENTESTPQRLPSFQPDSRVSLTALREKVWAIAIAAICGARLPEFSENFNRVGSSVKIRPVYLQGKISDTSDEYSMTLPRWGIARGGEFGELLTSARHISATEFSLWRTPMASDGEYSQHSNDYLVNGWKNRPLKHLSEQVAFMETFPTPKASRHEDCPAERRRHSPSLESYVVQFPTPTVKGNYNRKGASKTSGNGLATVVGGKLNPTWVEWLMGFPLGWTDLDV